MDTKTKLNLRAMNTLKGLDKHIETQCSFLLDNELFTEEEEDEKVSEILEPTRQKLRELIGKAIGDIMRGENDG